MAGGVHNDILNLVDNEYMNHRNMVALSICGAYIKRPAHKSKSWRHGCPPSKKPDAIIPPVHTTATAIAPIATKVSVPQPLELMNPSDISDR
jgi:hypothetical protein